MRNILNNYPILSNYPIMDIHTTKNRQHKASHKSLRTTLYKHLPCLMAITLTLCLFSCKGHQKRYVIGVSQCSEDTWRQKLNEELRIAALYYNDIDLRIESAKDDVRLQTKQIDGFVNDGVDLLIVAPGQVTISPAIDRAYEKGIPVIIFDRRTRSDKYTAYIGADNREIGAAMGDFLANSLGGAGHVVELCGLSSSSPAIERSEGFDSIATRRKGLDIVDTLHADWTKKGGYDAMDRYLSLPHPSFNCVFAHNDRMAEGVRQAAKKHGMDVNAIKFCGIDAMPQDGGGLQLVANDTLFASYIYPTRGDEVMKLAMNILQGKPYVRENRLSSALVTKSNARVLLMQYEEIVRQQNNLSALRSRIDKASTDFNTQRGYLLVLLFLVIMLVIAFAFAINAYRTKTRINHRLKDSMAEQKRMTEDMERMTQTQLQFFTNVSHELRTPLTLIAGPTEQLLEDSSIRPDQRSMLEMARRNIRILIQLVGEILNFRKVQTGKAELHLNRFPIYEELTVWAGDFRQVAARRKIAINVEVDDVARRTPVIADRDKLEHIYFNLMSNALKYTPEGGTITTQVSFGTDDFTISVTDTGKGIAEDELARLFERFYQARGSIGGTGIGLSLVKAYADLHNGKVDVKSALGKGTTFYVTLPLTRPGYDPANDTSARPATEQNLVDDSYVTGNISAHESVERITNAEDFDADRPLVLIIDDNNGMRAYLRSILKAKYNITEAADGKQGLETARREVPKIVVCDVMMPVMDGLEFTRRLKEDVATSHIPVILLTACSLSEQREEGYGTGADSYITKPFSGSVLLARIDNLLRSRSMLRSIFSGGKQEKEEEERLSAHDKSFVDKLREVIRDNMADSDFSVERLGEKVGLSRVQLYRKVKALTEQTPVELLRKARLERARLLIMQTDKNVAEIAYEVGFTAPSYFNKCYKDEFGVSPGAARER